MKKFRFPFFSKHQPIVANTKQIVDFKTGKPISEGISGGSGSGGSELNVLTVYGELHPSGKMVAFNIVGIEGTIQQINDALNKPFVVKLILKAFDEENNFANFVRVTNGGYSIDLNNSTGNMYCYYIDDITSPIIGYKYDNIPIIKIDNKIRLREDDEHFIAQTTYENPLDNSLVTITETGLENPK